MFLQYPPCQRELLILKREIFVASSPPLSHYYTLIENLYPNTNHIYLECKDYFSTWEALGICQYKLVSLGGAIWRYCEIGGASENKTPRSPLVAEAWRAYVLWVYQAWRVILVSLYSNLFTSGSFQLGGLQRGFYVEFFSIPLR